MEILKRVFYGLAIIVFVSCDVEGKPTSTDYEDVTVRNCGKSLLSFNNSPDRIVGGTDAFPGQYPWMVSLHERNDHGVFEHVCGATILNENWIVIAAHCIDYKKKSARDYEVLVGLHKLSEAHVSPTVRRHKISWIYLHGEYDHETLHDDIALLQVSQPIDIAGSGGYVNGVCLPQNKEDPSGYATVIGWGHTKEDGENSDILKQAVVPLIPRNICNEMYDPNPKDDEDEILDTMICAGITGKDSCQNDSGGPLLQQDSNGVTTLIGIVSHGSGCGVKFSPGIYTKISMYKTWIAATMDISTPLE